jgi:hypothetical protein
LRNEADVCKRYHVAEATLSRSGADDSLHRGESSCNPRPRPLTLRVLFGLGVAVSHCSHTLQYTQILYGLSVAANDTANLRSTRREEGYVNASARDTPPVEFWRAEQNRLRATVCRDQQMGVSLPGIPLWRVIATAFGRQ